MNERLIDQLLILILTIGWSLVFYLAKRTINSIDKKMDANFLRIEQVGDEIGKRMNKRDLELEKGLKDFSSATSQNFNSLYLEMDKKSREDTKEVNRRVEGLASVYSKIFVSRQEFGAFTANINYKLDSIYQFTNRERDQN